MHDDGLLEHKLGVISKVNCSLKLMEFENTLCNNPLALSKKCHFFYKMKMKWFVVLFKMQIWNEKRKKFRNEKKRKINKDEQEWVIEWEKNMKAKSKHMFNFTNYLVTFCFKKKKQQQQLHNRNLLLFVYFSHFSNL